MPSKKGATDKMPAARAPTADESLNRKRFEKELQGLARKAKKDAEGSNSMEQSKIFIRTALLLSLLGVYAVVSQRAMSPVYGEIPASLSHKKVLMVGCFIGWAGNIFFRNHFLIKPVQLLPFFSAYIPVIQFYLYTYSEQLGSHWGPIVTEGLTLGPLCVLTASSVADLMENADLSMLPKSVADAAPGIGSWGFLKLMMHIAAQYLRIVAGRGFMYTRMGTQAALTGIYTATSPSKFWALMMPAMMHLVSLNTHTMIPATTSYLNTTLQGEGWLLLDRQESLTGYISVIESLERGFRVMRCDHSLLGGEWVTLQGQPIREPIYGVFVMLEGVRLVKREQRVPDKDASALVIGLGIGTTPSALVQHGIDTTVVEIDPVVHQFAEKYFGLQENNPAVLKDAIKYTAQLAEESMTYDYIVHDVFTGGAEPVGLFTLEFLQSLSSLLKPDGVVAINYAGDLSQPAPRIVVNTIKEVFPSCRIFRESPPDAHATEAAGMDFTNMVIFCKKTSTPIAFRHPVVEDFLQSRARQRFLEPKHEVLESDLKGGDDVGILRKNNTEVVTKWHESSAVGHWEVMRTVLPSKIWELW
ncbi:spermine/spermidine synthase domain-containing protein [Sarocladium implicatum]|nr:spermine/spermidine synthase domain-containing protein [Sarocladium implicatum]